MCSCFHNKNQALHIPILDEPICIVFSSGCSREKLCCLLIVHGSFGMIGIVDWAYANILQWWTSNIINILDSISYQKANSHVTLLHNACVLLVLLPGTYASLNLIGAYLGWPGYDYNAVPSYDDWDIILRWRWTIVQRFPRLHGGSVHPAGHNWRITWMYKMILREVQHHSTDDYVRIHHSRWASRHTMFLLRSPDVDPTEDRSSPYLQMHAIYSWGNVIWIKVMKHQPLRVRGNSKYTRICRFYSP